MRPYDKINIGDIYARPYLSQKYTVVNKSGGMIELRSSYQHPSLPETFWKKPTDSIFNYPYFINEYKPVPSLSERAVEERAIEKVINIVLNMNWDVMQNTIDAQELLSKLRELKTLPE